MTIAEPVPGIAQPRARHAQHAGLGGRVGSACGEPECCARGQQHDTPEAGRPHGRQKGLDQLDGRTQMQFHQGIQVAELHIRQKRRFDDARVVNEDADFLVCRQVPGGRCGGSPIGQIHFHARQAGMMRRGRAPCQRDDFMAALEQMLADRPADAGASAGDHRHTRTAHCTHSTGKPSPPGIVSAGSNISDSSSSWCACPGNCPAKAGSQPDP